MTSTWNAAEPWGRTPLERFFELQTAHDAGANVVRIWISEAVIPGSFGSGFDAKMDQLMGWARDFGLKVILVMYDAGIAASGAAIPANNWRDNVRHWLDRYSELYAFEVWNEPNLNAFWKGTAAQYATLVNESVAAKALAGSSAKIIAGVFAGTAGNSVSFLNSLYAAGMTGHDGISTHPYSLGASWLDPRVAANPYISNVEAVRAAMQSNGDGGKPMMLTEFGFATSPGVPSVPDDTQRLWLHESFWWARAHWSYVTALTAFSIADFDTSPPGAGDWPYHCGIVSPDQYVFDVPESAGPVRPSNVLHAEVEDVNGHVWRWDANDRLPQNRPQNMSYRTQRGDGFAEGSVTLRRPIDRDFPDIALLHKLRFVGEDGFIAYEGRISEFPRELGAEGETIVVTAAGYMASARDRKMSEIYVSRDLSRFTDPPNDKIAAVNAFTVRVDQSFQQQIKNDGNVLLKMQWNRLLAGIQAMYATFISPDVPLGAIWYDETNNDNQAGGGTGPNGMGTGQWTVSVNFNADLGNDADTGTGNLLPTPVGDSDRGYFEPTPPAGKTWAMVHYVWVWNGSPAADGDWQVNWKNPAVYGAHGLTRQGPDPGGFTVSQMLRNIIGRFCPQLSVDGVADTTYVVRDASFIGVDPFDAMIELNRYHQWELNCWEGGVVYFTEPPPLDDWDWEIRTDDRGTTVNLHGDSIADLANGISVTFDDLKGIERTVTPEDDASLRDFSEDNPCNIWGIERWLEPPGGKLPGRNTREDAVQIGRAALGEALMPKSPGEINVTGWIRDRRGNLQPIHKVRCGERVRIVNHPNDRPRRIVDTSWSGGDEKTLAITTDNVTKRVEGYLDRLETARRVAGL